MKTLEIKNKPLWDLSEQVQPGVIRLTRGKKTVAYLLLASEYDEEDIGYMTDPEFWKMIRERRRSDRGVSLEQVEAELVERERAIKRKSSRRNGARSKRSKE